MREAQARHIEAQAEYKRIVKDIYQRQLVSRAQMDSATAGFNAAKARLDAAQAGVAQAKESLGYTTINAPTAASSWSAMCSGAKPSSPARR